MPWAVHPSRKVVHLNGPALEVLAELARRRADNPWVIDGHFVEVGDVDAHCERARAAGATILHGPDEPGYGFRVYSAEDPEGHRWMFGQRLA